MKPSRNVRKIGKLVATLTAQEWANITLEFLVKMPPEVADMIIEAHDNFRMGGQLVNNNLNESEQSVSNNETHPA